MMTLALIIKLMMLVDFSSGIAVSYNQPKFSPCASWDGTALSFSTTTWLGQGPDGIFVHTDNTVYIASRANMSIEGWQQTSPFQPVRTIRYTSGDLIGLFVSTNSDIYVGVGSSDYRVDKWALNATAAEKVMNVSSICSGLFIDINNTLYCSMQDGNQVVKKSLNSSDTISFIAAGNGFSGSGPYMLDRPRGIFVDTKLCLYVADRGNNRIQRFDPGQLNGTTVAGNGTIEITGNISLNEPTAVVLDADNYLFIVDSNNQRIVGSGPYGFRCLVGCFSSSGTQLNSPRNLGFDSYGNIFVTDKFINYIDIFLLSTNHCNATQLTTHSDIAAVKTTLFAEETTSIKPSTMLTTYLTQRASTHPIQMKTTRGSHSITNPPPVPNFNPSPCNDSYRIGVSCNTSNAPCDMLKPCQNEATCINNESIPNGYVCSCPWGFNGGECQFDIRPCKTNTCWNNGTCLNISDSKFSCVCAEGWEGIHCEIKINYCRNITCQNNGVCRPLFRDYQCECSSTSYSGRHCEITSSTLVARKIVSKSFGYIAIVCIVIVIGFFVVLDVLKYIFRIDPVRSELERLRRQKAPKKKKKNPPVAIRFKYVHQSPSQALSIVEETTV